MSPHLRKALAGVAVLATVAASSWSGYHYGYQAGLSAKGPQHRALVIVRRTPGNPNSAGGSYLWFDVSKPQEAAKFAREERRLKALGVDHYVARGVVETTVRPEPDLRRVNSHR